MTLRKLIPVFVLLGLGLLAGCASVMDPTNAEARGRKFSQAMSAQHSQPPKIPQNGSSQAPGQ